MAHPYERRGVDGHVAVCLERLFDMVLLAQWRFDYGQIGLMCLTRAANFTTGNGYGIGLRLSDGLFKMIGFYWQLE